MSKETLRTISRMAAYGTHAIAEYALINERALAGVVWC